MRTPSGVALPLAVLLSALSGHSEHHPAPRVPSRRPATGIPEHAVLI